MLLIFLPELFNEITDFEGRMNRVHEPACVLRSWVCLLHPFLVLVAALAIAARIQRFAPARALIGILGFTLWAFTEAGQQTLTLFAFDKWRLAYAAADETARAAIRIQTSLYDGLWDAMYVLLLIGFTAGNLCFGAALLRASGLARIVRAFLIAAATLTLAFSVGEIRGPVLPSRLPTGPIP